MFCSNPRTPNLKITNKYCELDKILCNLIWNASYIGMPSEVIFFSINKRR